jgi:phage shock protein C
MTEVQKKPKQLSRSETNKMIAGVCGGLAEYFNIDPTIVRLLFVLILLFGGQSILVYIILWIVIPTESAIKNK